MSLPASKHSRPVVDRRTIKEIEADLIAKIDFVKEYKDLGARLVSDTPRANGAIECFSLFRDEATPSAYINTITGKYGDSGARGKQIHIWQVAFDLQRFASWELARENYANQYGETFLRGKEGKRARKKLAGKEGISTGIAVAAKSPSSRKPLDNWLEHVHPEREKHRIFIFRFVTAKGGFGLDSALAAGGFHSRWPYNRKNDDGTPKDPFLSIFGVPVYGQAILTATADTVLDDSHAVGAIIWNQSCLPFVSKVEGKDEPVETKMKTVVTGDGLVGRHGIQLIINDRARQARGEPSQIDRIWKVEGPTDLMALWSIMPPEARERQPIVSCAGGSCSISPWTAEFVRGYDIYTIHDLDTAGQDGATKTGETWGPTAKAVYIVRLEGEVTGKHGTDLRDWIKAGAKFIDVDGLARFLDPFPVTDAHRVSLAKMIAAPAAEPTPSSSETRDDDPLGLCDTKNRTEAAQATRVAIEHGRGVRWSEKWKCFLFWDGRRWLIDNCRYVESLVKASNSAIWEYVEAIDADEDLTASLIGYAKSLNSANGIGNVLSLIRSEPGISVDHELFDSNHWLLNVENGVIDLRTNELLPHDPALMITKLAPVTFNPAAMCPTYRAFVRQIMVERDSLVDFLQRLAGYILTGSVREQVLPFFYGGGSNGKGVLTNQWLELLGTDYAMKAPPELLMVRNGDAHPTERADLFGKRFVLVNETDENRRLAEGLVKDLTGGDRIRARRMKENFWEFAPTHKFVMAGNHKPVIGGTDHGIWRRMRMVPFDRKFEGEEIDMDLPAKLAAERSGILNWFLEGCRLWQKNGLGLPQEVIDASEAYRSESDIIGQFIAERCQTATWIKERANVLYGEYTKWCEESGERRPLSGKRFGAALGERGFKKRTSNGVWYEGIGISSEI